MAITDHCHIPTFARSVSGIVLHRLQMVFFVYYTRDGVCSWHPIPYMIRQYNSHVWILEHTTITWTSTLPFPIRCLFIDRRLYSPKLWRHNQTHRQQVFHALLCRCCGTEKSKMATLTSVSLPGIFRTIFLCNTDVKQWHILFVHDSMQSWCRYKNVFDRIWTNDYNYSFLWLFPRDRWWRWWVWNRRGRERAPTNHGTIQYRKQSRTGDLSSIQERRYHSDRYSVADDMASAYEIYRDWHYGLPFVAWNKIVSRCCFYFLSFPVLILFLFWHRLCLGKENKCHWTDIPDVSQLHARKQRRVLVASRCVHDVQRIVGCIRDNHGSVFWCFDYQKMFCLLVGWYFSISVAFGCLCLCL